MPPSGPYSIPNSVILDILKSNIKVQLAENRQAYFTFCYISLYYFFSLHRGSESTRRESSVEGLPDVQGVYGSGSKHRLLAVWSSRLLQQLRTGVT